MMQLLHYAKITLVNSLDDWLITTNITKGTEQNYHVYVVIKTSSFRIKFYLDTSVWEWLAINVPVKLGEVEKKEAAAPDCPDSHDLYPTYKEQISYFITGWNPKLTTGWTLRWAICIGDSTESIRMSLCGHRK